MMLNLDLTLHRSIIGSIITTTTSTNYPPVIDHLIMSATEGKMESKGEEKGEMEFVSYNILGSKLSTPSFNKGCKPEHLDKDLRYPRIVRQLMTYTDRRAIIALQECDEEWYDRLSVFFEEEDYVCFGRPTGFIGCLIAYPSERYRAIRRKSIDMSSEIANHHKKQLKATEFFIGNYIFGLEFVPQAWWAIVSVLCKLMLFILAWVSKLPGMSEGPARFRFRKRVESYVSRDPWVRATRQKMVVLVVELEHLESKKRFCVASNHSPCSFLDQPLMKVHIGMMSYLVQQFAGDLPLLIGTDLNTKPIDDCYKLMTGPGFGVVEGIKIGARSLDSACMEVHGREPTVTNYTTNFKETLDYIFVSRGDCRDVKVQSFAIPDVPTSACPNEHHPSDHLPISTSLT